jgi:hypothetical protein
MYQWKPPVAESQDDLRQELAGTRAEIANLKARLEALEARPAKVELGEEFDGIRQLSYHLQHGGLTPFLADRAWWPNLGTHIMWAMIAFIVILFGWGYLIEVGIL